jgi:hypothetical protein
LQSEKKTFLKLCELLSLSDGQETHARANIIITNDHWDDILSLANRHRVSPAVWRALESRYGTAVVPDPIARSLGNVFKLNERRNKLILQQFTDAVALLNEHAIVPVALKTLVNMLETPTQELGIWTTRDIDLLVARADFFRAAERLEKHGYVPKTAFNSLMHSYPALYRPGELVGVDLHRDLGPQRMLVAAEEAFSKAKQAQYQGCAVKILVPTHRLLHLLYHDEIQDRRFELGRISLHQLLNFRYLVARYDEQIDWSEVKDRLRLAGFPSLLPSYCYMVEQLLGVKSANFPKVGWRGKLHYRRCIAQMDSRLLQSLMTTWETITPPAMSKKDIEYMAGNTSFIHRLKHRLAFVWDVWRRNGAGIFRKVKLLQRMRVQRR